VLDLAFKANPGDEHDSLAHKLRGTLEEEFAGLAQHDPYGANPTLGLEMAVTDESVRMLRGRAGICVHAAAHPVPHRLMLLVARTRPLRRKPVRVASGRPWDPPAFRPRSQTSHPTMGITPPRPLRVRVGPYPCRTRDGT
jgi:hypothetical protein